MPQWKKPLEPLIAFASSLKFRSSLDEGLRLRLDMMVQLGFRPDSCREENGCEGLRLFLFGPSMRRNRVGSWRVDSSATWANQ